MLAVVSHNILVILLWYWFFLRVHLPWGCLALLLLPQAFFVAAVVNGVSVLIGMLLIIFADDMGSQFYRAVTRWDEKVKAVLTSSAMTGWILRVVGFFMITFFVYNLCGLFFLPR